MDTPNKKWWCALMLSIELNLFPKKLESTLLWPRPEKWLWDNQAAVDWEWVKLKASLSSSIIHLLRFKKIWGWILKHKIKRTLGSIWIRSQREIERSRLKHLCVWQVIWHTFQKIDTDIRNKMILELSLSITKFSKIKRSHLKINYRILL